MIKSLIFDLDGTLIDSNRIHFLGFQRLFRKVFGVSVSANEVMPLYGESIREIAVNLLRKHKVRFSNEELEEFVKLKIRDYDKAIRKRHLLKKQTFNFLKRLKKQGFKLAVASGTERRMLEASLKLVERKLFDVLVCADDVQHSKPFPDELKLVLKKLKVKNSEAVYVGDSLMDAVAAKNSRIRFVGFLSGIASRKEFEKAGAIAVIRKIPELASFL